MFKYNFKVYDAHYVRNNIFSADALILKNVPLNARVLEVWCARGHMSKYMKEDLWCEVIGVDFSEEAAQEANHFQSKTYIGDLDDENFLKTIQWTFDCILFPAVLEHLKYPERVLSSLLQRLKPWWIVIISLPNIAHYTTRFSLLFWNFNYSSYGILDNTHLRFFTYHTAKKLIQQKQNGTLRVTSFMCSFPFPGAGILVKIPIIKDIIYFLINKVFFRLFWEELIFICTKQ